MKREKEILVENLPLIIYDGECMLCSGFIHRVFDRVPEKYYYSDGKSEVVAEWIKRNKAETESSIYLIDKYSQVHKKSDAAIKILHEMGGIERLFAVLARAFPRLIRDRVYDIIARYRKKWQKQACPMPSRELRTRIL